MYKLKSFTEFLKEETLKKYAVVFAMLLVFSFLCEIFVFNYKWIDSITSDEIKIQDMQTSGIRSNGDKLVFDNQSASITIRNIGREVKYLGFVLEDNKSDDEDDVLNITLSAKDEANASNELAAPERTVTTASKTSQYIPLHFSGDIDSMRIMITKQTESDAVCSGIILNAKVPLLISLPRILIFALILAALYTLRPKSGIYSIITDLHSTNQRIAAVLIIIAMSAVLANMIKWNTDVTQWHKSYEHHQMYYELVDAFKNGHLYLDDEPSQSLKNMENPYDFAGRYEANAQFKWDHAYFEGKYYVYFGAVPAVLMYLPYNIITGGDLPNYIAVYIICVFLIAGIMLLLWEIIKKWFKKTPFVLYILMSVTFAAAPALTYASYKPDFYLVPVLAALTFAVYGTALWISAEATSKQGNEILIPWRLCIGSLCIALTAGCRPQFLVAIVFGVILLWNRVFKTRELFSKKGMKSTLSLCVPFVVIGIIIMIYNAARFHSPFDFGANYNLTTNDMTQRGFVWGRTGLGIFTYLLQPVRIDALFPFLHDFNKATAYQGLTLTENLMGGVIWLYPILFIGIYGMMNKELFDDKRIYRIICAGFACAVIVAVADTQMAGLLTRYYTDFVWLMMIGSIVTVFALYDKAGCSIKARSTVINVTVALTLATLVLAFLSIFAHTEDAVLTSNPGLYYKIQHMIAFWL